MCWSKFEHKLYYGLMQPLEQNNLDKSLWNDKCDYTDITKCTNLNSNNYNFIIMQFNIRSLITCQTCLKHTLKTLKCKNSLVNIILLCETFLLDQTVNQVQIPGYSIIDTHRKNSKGGGIAIPIKNGIKYRWRSDLEEFHEKELEGTYAEIQAKNGKSFMIRSLYKSPNISEKRMITHLHQVCPIVYEEKGSKELIIGLDHNMDLLKSHQHKAIQGFLDTFLNYRLLPAIIRPTRITNNTATLVNNIFISERLFDSTILIGVSTDHLPLLLLIKQTKILDKTPLEFKNRMLNEKKKWAIRHHLLNVDWNKTLTSKDCNDNFN